MLVGSASKVGLYPTHVCNIAIFTIKVPRISFQLCWSATRNLLVLYREHTPVAYNRAIVWASLSLNYMFNRAEIAQGLLFMCPYVMQSLHGSTAFNTLITFKV